MNVPQTPRPLLIPLVVLDHGQGLPLPSHATALSAGVDLYAAIKEPLTLQPFERQAVPSGIALQLPQGYEGQIRPRSGLALKHGITVLNTPGTIDADYRGELLAILVNFSQDPFNIDRGMRMAQLVIAPHCQVSWSLQETLEETQRQRGRFGSTGY